MMWREEYKLSELDALVANLDKKLFRKNKKGIKSPEEILTHIQEDKMKD